MLTKEGLNFLLRITDFFGGHWEDPGWGQKPINQVLIMLSAHTLVGGISDKETQRQVQAALERALADTAQKIVKNST
ncbi:MAG: hypothetical protein ACT4O2_02820 [Beijerinckiaceae bacterium]